MEEIDAQRLGLVLAFNAEIEAMKAENDLRKHNGEAPAYGEKDFIKVAEQLKHISTCGSRTLAMNINNNRY